MGKCGKRHCIVLNTIVTSGVEIYLYEDRGTRGQATDPPSTPHDTHHLTDPSPVWCKRDGAPSCIEHAFRRPKRGAS